MKDLLISALIVIAIGMLPIVFARMSVKTQAETEVQQHPCEVRLGKEIHIFPDCKMLGKESL